METTEICPLTKETITRLLSGPEPASNATGVVERRQVQRWPFPGTVELWIPQEGGGERHALATSLNLSVSGVGIRCDEELPTGLKLAIAIHEPEMSLHGRAVVRHCSQIDDDYLIGLQFIFKGV